MTIDETTEARVYERLRVFDGLEVAGHAPVNSSIASVLSEGEVLADNGEQYSSIQQAVDVSDGFVFVGPGTYYENVVIDKDGFMLQGAGHDTLIDGGIQKTAMELHGDNITIKNLSVSTTGTSGSSSTLVSSANGLTIDSVTVRDSDRHGIDTDGGNDLIINNCVIENTTQHGILIENGVRAIVSNCVVQSGSRAIYPLYDDSIVVNNVVNNPGRAGMRVQTNDSLIGGNRIINSGDEGIDISDNDNIIYNNRISDSGGNGDIKNNGSGTVLDGNLTGSAN
jgi:pectin methylesterase-like acyl-CoA thioesterase